LLVSNEVDTTFYATVAQVIPVLFVLLFVELWRRDREEQLGSMAPFLLGVVTLLIGAEAVSLKIVKDGSAPTWTDEAVVAGALVWSALVAVAWVVPPMVRSIAKSRVGAWLLLTYFLGLAAMLALVSERVVSDSVFIAYAAGAPALIGVLVPFVADMVRDFRRAMGLSRRDEKEECEVRRHLGITDVLVGVAVIMLALRRRD
jgi:hypothetical protein